MSDQNNLQEPTEEQKELKQKDTYAILSFIFGLVSIFLAMMGETGAVTISGFFCGVTYLLPLLAIALGVYGLKSSQRTLAILGIVFSSGALLYLIYQMFVGIGIARSRR